MNLEDLRLFAAVARLGSFTAAGRQLGLPKGTVSRRVAGFERALGVKLLHRSTRQVTLSEAGERLLGRTEPLLEDLQAAGEEIQSLQHEPRGLLRLQVPLAFLADDTATLIAGFAAAHPRVTVQCAHYVGSGRVDPGDFDLTLLAYEWQLPPSDWIARPLMSLRQGIFAAPGVSPSRRLSLPALSALPAVVAIDETFWRFRDGAGVQAVAVSGAVQLDNPTMRLRAAEHGAGLLRAPAALTEAAVRAGRLVELAPALPPVALSVAMLYRSRAMPAKVRAFMDHLQSAPMLRSVAVGG